MGSRTRIDGVRLAAWLVGASLAYNLIEAVLALWWGSEAASIALLGFGLDSAIETSASALVLRRLVLEVRGRSTEDLENTEHRVHRFVGATFLALALYVTAQSSWTLWRRAAPDESILGIVLACVSVVLMPGVAAWKLKLAKQIGSGALRAEAKETLACAFLSLALLIGLSANALAGWWWADPIAALCMVPWLVHEGREGLAGGCGHHAPASP